MDHLVQDLRFEQAENRGESGPMSEVKPDGGRRDSGRRAATAFYSVLVSAVACGGDAEAPVLTELRDSAGAFTHESPRRRWGDRSHWTVGLDPILSLPEPGAGVEREFYGISDVARLPDGRIVVAVPFELRVFSPAGGFVQAVGREGEGPGEFRSAPRLGLLGDSLVAFDFRASRATIYGPTLEANEVVQFEGGMYQPGFAIVGTSFALIKSTSALEGTDVGRLRPPTPVVFFSRNGRVIDTLATVAGTELLRLEREDGYLVEAPVFGRRAHVAASENHVYLGDATALEFRVVDPGGSPERIAKGLKDLRLTAEDIEEARRAILGDEPSPSLRRRCGMR